MVIKDKSKKKRLGIFLLLALLLLLGGAVGHKLFFNQTAENSLETEGVSWEGKKETSSKAKPSSIAIPGYDSMTLKAGSLEQAVNFYNPEENDCYFKISLKLPDETTIWASKLIEPGNGLYAIKLEQMVAAGEYENAVLEYQCFTFDEKQSELNGSAIKLKLIFQ